MGALIPDQSQARRILNSTYKMSPLLEPVVHKLGSIGALSQKERAALFALPTTSKEVPPHADVVREGDRPSMVTVVLEGLLCRYKYAEGGTRQILSFHVPGDIPDVMSLFIKIMDHHLGTMQGATVANIPHPAMMDLFAKHPNLAYLFWRGTLIEASIFRQWMVGLGGLDAYPRMAHLLCEIMTQMKAAGQAEDGRCALPITQAELGEATGISTVHVNRTLQRLRRNKLIELQAGWLTITNPVGLKAVGEFDPSYMHLEHLPD